MVDSRRQITDPDSTYQVVRMMQDVIARGTGVVAGAGIDRPIAGKTGTSQDFNDAWFAGFAPNLLTVVWIGFDNPQSLGEKEDGGHVAGPVWNGFMKQALGGHAEDRLPGARRITLVRYNAGLGSAVDGFKPGQEPGMGSMIASGTGSDQLGPQDTGAENVPRPGGPDGGPAGHRRRADDLDRPVQPPRSLRRPVWCSPAPPRPEHRRRCLPALHRARRRRRMRPVVT